MHLWTMTIVSGRFLGFWERLLSLSLLSLPLRLREKVKGCGLTVSSPQMLLMLLTMSAEVLMSLDAVTRGWLRSKCENGIAAPACCTGTR